MLTTYQNQLSNYTKSIPKVQKMHSGILVLSNIVLFLCFFGIGVAELVSFAISTPL